MVLRVGLAGGSVRSRRMRSLGAHAPELLHDVAVRQRHPKLHTPRADQADEQPTQSPDRAEILECFSAGGT